MKKLLLIALFLPIVFLSCNFFPSEENMGSGNEDIIPIQRQSKGKWSILIYMAADNNLESEAIEDIWEMETSSLNTKMTNVLFLLDRHPSYDISNGNWSGTKMFKLKTGRSSTSKDIISQEIDCKELDLVAGNNQELDMSDTHVLAKAVSFMMNNYKSDYYGLIIWGHGTGWRNEGNDLSSVSKNKAFGFDGTSGTYMSLSQLNYALEVGLNGRKLDYIGFDTCFGGELEVMYELKDKAKYGVGVPGLLISAGWNYKSLFNNFTIKTEREPLDLCESTISQFKKEYAHKDFSAISAFDLEKADSFFDSFENLMKSASEQINSTEKRDQIINDIYANCIMYTEGTPNSDVYLDLWSLVNIVGNNFEIENEIDDFRESNNNFTVNGWATNSSEVGPGIFFATLSESGLFSTKHPSGYIRGAATDQIEFVKNSRWYVPSKNREGSFIDTIFYNKLY